MMVQDTKISELPKASALAGGEAMPLVQSGQTRRTTVAELLAGLAPASHGHPADAITNASSAGRALLTAADAAAQRTALGIGSLGTQASSSVLIGGGSIDGTSIGTVTAAPGRFTDLSATGVVDAPGVRLGAAANQHYLYDGGPNTLSIRLNSGGTPTAYFSIRTDSASSGVALVADGGNIALEASGGQQVLVAGSEVQVAVPVRPRLDGATDLGSASLRWNDVYATNATIQTSDARIKTAVEPCPLGLDFILALRPVRYRFADVDEPAVTVRRTVERTVTAPVTRTREEVRFIDGRYRLMTIEETVEEPVLRYEPLFDAEGRPLLDESGAQRRHPVPVTEMVEVEEEQRPARRLAHHRPHDGLIAQEVKAALDARALDMAGYVYNPETDRHGLRYGEFIAPLIRAVQELALRVAGGARA